MPVNANKPADSHDIAQRWAELREANPGLRNRDAAEKLGISEAELIASRCGSGTLRLRPDWPAFFAALPGLGQVMALTRNEDVVHERRGTYSAASFQDHVGLVLGPDIDLRIFLKNWQSLFTVEETGRKGLLKSFQVFDGTGTAVHKIYAEDTTDSAAWDALVAALTAPEQPTTLEVKPKAAPATSAEKPAVDREAFLTDWSNLKDTHEFQGLIVRHKVKPMDAFRLAEGRYATRLGNDCVNALLTNAAATELPIMVFVGNAGIIQIHTGPVHRIEHMGPWLNVLDAAFNLHLREDRIAESWLVRKPTVDGIVTSVETFTEAGDRIATFFGKRKPGEPELTAWRDLAEGLAQPAPNQGGAAA